jgi:hypothetical protein
MRFSFYSALSILIIVAVLFFEEDNVKSDQQSMILSYNKEKEKGIILGNMLIYVAKWTIMDNILCKTATIIRILKAE